MCKLKDCTLSTHGKAEEPHGPTGQTGCAQQETVRGSQGGRPQLERRQPTQSRRALPSTHTSNQKEEKGSWWHCRTPTPASVFLLPSLAHFFSKHLYWQRFGDVQSSGDRAELSPCSAPAGRWQRGRPRAATQSLIRPPPPSTRWWISAIFSPVCSVCSFVISFWKLPILKLLQTPVPGLKASPDVLSRPACLQGQSQPLHQPKLPPPFMDA